MEATFAINDYQAVMSKVNSALEKYVTPKKVTVGIHADKAQIPDDDDTTYAYIGAKLHFGSVADHIPARPWLDVGVEHALKEKGVISSIINQSGENTEQILEMIGVVAATGTAQFMIDLRDPPNAPATIKAKGSSNPLVDTGNLVKTVQYKIVDR